MYRVLRWIETDLRTHSYLELGLGIALEVYVVGANLPAEGVLLSVATSQTWTGGCPSDDRL
jgi:hypothetical protein